MGVSLRGQQIIAKRFTVDHRRRADFWVLLPSTNEDDEPWTASPSRRNNEPPIEGPIPKSVEVVLGNQVYIDRSKLPPALVNRIARLAAFQNPEFYAAQAMRLPTFGKPRVISCAELFSKHVALPRGCLDDLMGVLGSVGVAAELREERQYGQSIAARFLGELMPEQNDAAAALFKNDTGELAAATAFGKTVVAAKMIASRGRNTLVLVHRRQLLEQWVARSSIFGHPAGRPRNHPWRKEEATRNHRHRPPVKFGSERRRF